ncbi:MAG TPA: hypothetical protein H9694_04330 [Firmicutes bacterium]|nr:hypothetical protein [Bacillota bacterium]
MILSLCSLAAMTGMFLYMFNKAVLARTRRMALLPLLCAVIEGLAAGALTPSLAPALTVVLTVLRLTILLCCAGAMHQDAAAARRRARQRRRQAAQGHAAPVVSLPVARPIPTDAVISGGNSRRTAGRCA